MVFVHYQHRAYNNMQMSCTTHVRIQIQKNVTRTMDFGVCFNSNGGSITFDGKYYKYAVPIAVLMKHVHDTQPNAV